MKKKRQQTNEVPQVRGDAPALLTVPDVATRWQVTEQWVYRLIDEGKLQPVVRLGRLVRIKLATIEAYENARTTNVKP